MTYQTETKVSLLPKSIVKKIRVLVVDDQNLHCHLLQVALETEADIEVVDTANNGNQALELAQRLQPDIILMDIEMPGMDGITTTQELNKLPVSSKVIILTSHNEPKFVNRAFQVGAKGYLLKDTSARELADAIRFVEQNYLHFGRGLFTTTEDQGYPHATYEDAKPSEQNIVLVNKELPKDFEEDWSVATKDLLDALPRAWTRGLFYLMVIFTAVILPWLTMAKIDETGTARGKLEPKDTTVRLDAPVNGTVAATKVEEGDTVKADQVLLELESDVIRAELQELEGKRTGQLNRLTQLELLKNQLSVSIQTQKQQNQAQQLEKQAQIEQARQNLNGLQAVERAQKTEKLAQLEQFKQAIDASNANYRLAVVALTGAKDKAVRYERAFQDGVIPEDRLKDIQQQAKENSERLAQADSELKQARSRVKEHQSNYDKLIQQTESEIQQSKLRLEEQEGSYQSLVHSGKLSLLKTEEQLKDLATQISDLNSEIAQTVSQINSLKFQLTQRVVKAPANGTVFHLPISGAGAVVQSGERIVEIAPEGSPLILKAMMNPTESGSLEEGMPVKVKFDAYPFQDYGVLSGTVIWISPDSKISETERGKEETFELKIELERAYLEGNEGKITLTPGQTATAEVIVRQRRLSDFILDPFKKLQKGGLDL